MVQKKSYLLLELMIAFALITLCAFPLMRVPLSALKTEKAVMEKIQLERCAEEIFCDIYALFLEEKLQLPTKQENTLQELKPRKTDMDITNELNYTEKKLPKDWVMQASYKIDKCADDKSKTKTIYQIGAQIMFTKKKKKNTSISFSQFFFLKREVATLLPIDSKK